MVVVTFAPERSRDLPLTVASLPIFSEAYYRNRDFEASTLEAPLGSGPYSVGRFEVGRFIEFERVADYWARDLPVARRAQQLRPHPLRILPRPRRRLRRLQGRRLHLSARSSPRASGPTATISGRSRTGASGSEVLPDETPSGMQGWWLNTRREKFRDPRVREAVGLAFDFEWTNQNLMFGAYRRTASFFENSDMKADGKPSPEELALLEPWRGKVPDEVFGEPFSPPRSDGSGQDRNLLRRADALLRDAGCRRDGNVLRLPGGQPFEIEFLDCDAEPAAAHAALSSRISALLGIGARSRIVDAAQYQRRDGRFRFRHGQPPLQRRLDAGRSRCARSSRRGPRRSKARRTSPASPIRPSTRCSSGSSAAKTRDELRVACRALDRVLRAGRYWVPMWYKRRPLHRLLGPVRPPGAPPKYDLGAPATWWYDADKAQRIGKTG